MKDMLILVREKEVSTMCNIDIENCDRCNALFVPDFYSLEYYGDTNDLYCSRCLSIIESQAEMREDFLNMEG